MEITIIYFVAVEVSGQTKKKIAKIFTFVTSFIVVFEAIIVSFWMT